MGDDGGWETGGDHAQHGDSVSREIENAYQHGGAHHRQKDGGNLGPPGAQDQDWPEAGEAD
jgi:hypothetical protein